MVKLEQHTTAQIAALPTTAARLVYDSDLNVVKYINGTEPNEFLAKDGSGNIAATITTAAQPNITSVGTLTGLSVNTTSSMLAGDLSGTNGRLRFFGSGGTYYFQTAIAATSGSSADVFFGNYNHDTTTSARKFMIKADGTVGIGTTTPDKQLEINSATGDCLRLTYNDSNGSATDYCDFSISSDVLTIAPSNSGYVYIDGRTYVRRTSDSTFKVQNSGGSTTAMNVSANALSVGIATTSIDKALEINSATGDCLRLTYNDSNGSAANYSDFTVSSGGDLTITASGGDINLAGHSIYKVVDIDFTTAGYVTGEFYPIAMYTTNNMGSYYNAPIINFNIGGMSFGGGDSYNDNSMIGIVRGGGWTDKEPVVDVLIIKYDDTEHRFLGIYEGSAEFSYGVVIYARGGYTYSLQTDAEFVDIGTSGAALSVDTSTFAVKDAAFADVTGTSANISLKNSLLTESGRYTNHNMYLMNGASLGIEQTTISTSDTSIHTLKTSNFNHHKIESSSTAHGAICELKGDTKSWKLISYGSTNGQPNKFAIHETSAGDQFYIIPGGNVGIKTSAPDKALEVNSATGDCLRLTYNDSNGGATTYTDFAVDTNGYLTILPSGGEAFIDTSILNISKSTTTAIINSSLLSKCDISVHNKKNDTGANSGIGFLISSGAYDATIPGGSIIFERTGSGSIGDFLFSTKSATNCEERMRIMSTGFIGINTSAPDKQLEVNSATGDCLRLTYNDSNGSATTYCDLTVDSSGDLAIVPSSGNVGIGTTTPGNPLHVKNGGYHQLHLETTSATSGATMQLSTPSKSWQMGIKGASSSPNDSFYIYGDSAYKLVINPSGDVSIGTTTSVGKLYVYEAGTAGVIATFDNNVVGGGGYIEVTNNVNTRCLLGPDGTNFSGGSTADVILANWSNGNLKFFCNAAQKMVIEPGGHIGMNTTNPDKVLEINSSAGEQFRLTYNDSNGSATVYTDINCTSGGQLYLNPTGNDVKMELSGANCNIYKSGTSDTAITNTGGGGLYMGTSLTNSILVTSGGNMTFLGSAANPAYNFTSNASGRTILQIESTAGSSTVQQELKFHSHSSSRGGGITWDTNSNTRTFLGRCYNAGGAITELRYNVDTTGGNDTFAENNTKFMITDDGNVFINAGNLDVTDTNGQINIIANTAGQLSMVKFYTVGDDWECGARSATSGNANTFYIYSNASSAYRLIILPTTGYIGINTSLPGKQLEINSSDGNCLRLTYNDSNGSAGNYCDFTMNSSGNLFINPSGGNVGIGTSVPSESLDIFDGNIRFGHGNAYAADNYLYTHWTDPSNDHQIGMEFDYYIGSGGTGTTHSRLNFISNAGLNEAINGASKQTMMTILSNGDVGIGDTVPEYNLDIQSSGNNNYIRVQAGATAANFSGILFTEHNINWGWHMRLDAATDKAHIGYQDNTPTFTDLMTFDRANYVGIGESSPGYRLDLGATANDRILALWASGSFYGFGANGSYLRYSGDNGHAFYTDSTTSSLGDLRLTVSTTVLTTTEPIEGPLGSVSNPTYSFTGDNNTGIYSSAANAIKVACAGTNVMHFDNGQIIAYDIFKASATAELYGNSSSRTKFTSADVNGEIHTINFWNTYSGSSTKVAAAIICEKGSNNHAGDIVFKTNTSSANNLNVRMRIDQDGAVSIGGSLSKGSGSFDIEHPLPNKKNEGYRLVHSFVEGPRCDLIYRGNITLVNGSATIDLNKDSMESSDCNMTDGTFEALCKNPDFYLQNKTGFDRVKGNIVGALLTITCENVNNNEDIISWMVVAERKDDHINEWKRTNLNGSLVTEYKT